MLSKSLYIFLLFFLLFVGAAAGLTAFKYDKNILKLAENKENKESKKAGFNYSKEIKINNISVFIEEAKTGAERTKGLSNRNEIGENEGMLFIFDLPNIYYFWMREMNFPIDIIWIDENKKITSILKNVSPETFPEFLYPNGPVKYVLEVRSGFADKNGIKEGDLAEF